VRHLESGRMAKNENIVFYKFGWKNDMGPNRKFVKDIVKQESTRYKYDRCFSCQIYFGICFAESFPNFFDLTEKFNGFRTFIIDCLMKIYSTSISL
jgi:hypothetical protein